MYWRLTPQYARFVPFAVHAHKKETAHGILTAGLTAGAASKEVLGFKCHPKLAGRPMIMLTPYSPFDPRCIAGMRHQSDFHSYYDPVDLATNFDVRMSAAGSMNVFGDNIPPRHLLRMIDDSSSTVPALMYDRANAKREYIGDSCVVGPFYTGPSPPANLQGYGGGTRERNINLHRFSKREFREWALSTTWTIAWNCRGAQERSSRALSLIHI